MPGVASVIGASSGTGVSSAAGASAVAGGNKQGERGARPSGSDTALVMSAWHKVAARPDGLALRLVQGGGLHHCTQTKGRIAHRHVEDVHNTLGSPGVENRRKEQFGEDETNFAR